ncbi:MAG TPA: hypothetical protein PKY86_09980 [Niabella sp.]|nr:hypothetical protein [Niabella sp.]
MPKDVKGLRFNVQFDEKPKEENLTYQVIVFDLSENIGGVLSALSAG